MWYLALVAVLTGCLGTAYGQRRPGPFWSLGGYGNVVFPGTGHAPHTPPGGVTGPYFMFPPAGRRGLVMPAEGHRGRNVDPVYVPYAVDVSGYQEDASAPDPNGVGLPIPMNSSPPPMDASYPRFGPPPGNDPAGEHRIDQTAAGIPTQSGVQGPRMNPPDKPTVYLVALKDHSIVRALGYWMEQGTLHYVSLDYSVNQVTPDLIDRALSQQLNEQRGIEFTLPLPRPN